MGLQPSISHTLAFRERECIICHRTYNSDHYLKSKSPGAQDGYSNICGDCIDKELRANQYDWETVNKYCQYLDIPFVPDKFEEMREINNEMPFTRYATIFFSQEYEQLNWHQYWEQFKILEQQNLITQELPRIKQDRLQKLLQKWGANYSEEQLNYLENLYQGMLLSQNVNGALQIDQAKKLCKTSLEIDERIRAGSDYDKMLSSYDKLVKIAEFTPKNTKNAADFDSTGELFHWLEKRGWHNNFYDGVTRDIVDETLKNIQTYNQRLYTNESGIGEEISRRIDALKTAADMESYYDTKQEFDIDNYENDGFEALMHDEEFKEDLDE